MQVFITILYIMMTISAIGLITVVVLQPGQASGMGALVGETEASFGKNSTKSFEQKLAKWTKISAAVLFVLSFTIALLEKLF
jgi:protein translocase SecG subunit